MTLSEVGVYAQQGDSPARWEPGQCPGAGGLLERIVRVNETFFKCSTTPAFHIGLPSAQAVAGCLRPFPVHTPAGPLAELSHVFQGVSHITLVS